jgi:hypothetical protein
MISLVRLCIIVIFPGLLWLGWTSSPEILTPKNMSFLGAIFLAVLGYVFLFLQKSAELTSLPGLSGREQERVAWRLSSIRRRIWWIVGVLVLAWVLVWFVAALPDLASSPFSPIAIGTLLGIGISYFAVIKQWFDDLYSFIDIVRVREDKKRKAEAALKIIADKRKAKPGG